jgi:DNA-directed RNA polymerase specialized sigma24 family protein
MLSALAKKAIARQTMNELSAQKTGSKKDWTLTPGAFQRLLSWLDADAGSDGRNYLEMRQRLVGYFDRKNCSTPDDLADETLNRVARRLVEEEVIESDTPAKYCYIVARFVFLEHLRETQKESVLLGEIQRQSPRPNMSEARDEEEAREKLLACLGQCSAKLEPAQRELITRYYVGKKQVKIENRRALAAELKITVNALSIRACRIRDKLEACVRQCVARD